MTEAAPIEVAVERSVFLRTLADLPELARRLWLEYRRQGARAAVLYTLDHVVRLVTGVPLVRFSRITPHLHIGGQYTGQGWRRLQQRGITSVVNLRDEFDTSKAGLVPETYLYLPTVDNTPPTMADLRRGIHFIEEEAARGGQVYVHCMLGVGRSATLAAAYLVAQGLTPGQAWYLLRRIRPFVQPTQGQLAVVEQLASDLAPKTTGNTGRR